MNKRFRVHTFHDLEKTKFQPVEYSALKFGSDAIAKKYGYELAEGFFNRHIDVLMSNSCVVIPSPYSHVENAATIMTKHFVNRINQLLVEVNGEHVEYSTIHRKVTYISDYGFLSKEKRKGLISNDTFYFNRQFIEGKTLIFIDDVRITGTHEEKLIEIMAEEKILNSTFFLYYGEYQGVSPSIEAELNFSCIQSMNDYITLVTNNECHVIVRTIKYLLGSNKSALERALSQLPYSFIEKIYYGSLGEGYYKIPAYQENFNLIKNKIKGA